MRNDSGEVEPGESASVCEHKVRWERCKRAEPFVIVVWCEKCGEQGDVFVDPRNIVWGMCEAGYPDDDDWMRWCWGEE